ncbi:gephyrin [Cimex lectularius]|uniref:MoaB/Mog domain-containing protein n=1 Tax=Cimex lectularius TaxID=79782 RepID=A0A8I6RKW1_CIMLE|nr:gephyrin [Cimex lectularius]
MHSIRFAILTVSDRCALGTQADLSGPTLKNAVDGIVLKEAVVPDEVEIIEEYLRQWSRIGSQIDIILTTGGTGFSQRDVTPEATLKVIDRNASGITTAMTIASLKVTPMAMLSRSVAGIKNDTMIVNLPGSVKGAVQCYEAIKPCLHHAVDLLRDRKEKINEVHAALPISKVRTDNIANRLRVSTWPMISMEEATKIVISQVKPPRRTVLPLKEVLGSVVADDIFAMEPQPPFRASVKDGYAVLAADGKGERRVTGSYIAGSDPKELTLQSLCCIRVNTGSPVPAGADAVVQVEDTNILKADEDGNEQLVEILVSPEVGQDIREIGCDLKEGELVLNKGTLINSAVHGLLASVGVSEVPVYQLPKVAVLSTGNELVAPGEKLRDGTVRDSNMTTLLSLLKENGYNAQNMGIARDEPSVLLAALLKSMSNSDVVITTGSVSMGDKDYLKRVLQEDLGATVHFGRLNMKPGKPTTFATCTGMDGNTKYLFCLPGNPVSATVTCHLLVLPMLKALSGQQVYYPTIVNTIIDFDVKLDERPEYRRAILEFVGESPGFCARSTGGQASSRLMSCRDANCLLLLPSSKVHTSGKICKGATVKAMIIGKL